MSLKALPTTSSLERLPEMTARVNKLREELAAAELELKGEVDRIRLMLNEALGRDASGKARAPEVLRLAKAGKSRDEIATELGMKPGFVDRSLRALVKKGLLEGPSAAAPAAAATGADDDDGDDEDDLPGSPSSEQLRRAVRLRIANGQSRARLMTELRKGHKHVAIVDGDGDGATTPGPKDEHVHTIKNFVCSPHAKDGHRHQVSTSGADK